MTNRQTSTRRNSQIVIPLKRKIARKLSRNICARPKGNIYLRDIRTHTSKKKLRRRSHQSRHPADKTRLNNATQQLKSDIQKIRNNSIGDYRSELSNDRKLTIYFQKSSKG